MSIDIKTLRVGNSVMVNGERINVGAIRHDAVGYISDIMGGRSAIAEVDVVNPIAITDSLLGELGFEYRKSSDSWVKAVTDKDSVFMTMYDDGMWQVMACPENYRHKMTFFCAELHALENFYYHVFGKELVEE